MLSLVMNPGLPDEQSFSLSEGTLTIGRTKDNVVFCLHKSLSRKHAKLEFDGTKVRITDLQSKNGTFFHGRKVAHCELVEGDSFRCGDITFLLEGTTARNPRLSAAAQTLPSPLALDPSLSKRPARALDSSVVVEDDGRYKDKLFLLIRASELLVSDLGTDRILDELVVLAVQVLEVDRIAILALDDKTLEIQPRTVKSFTSGNVKPYSKRVVDWVVGHGSPASFADVSKDRTLPGDAGADIHVRGAMCVPINPGNGTIGVLYADSVTRSDCFRADDLALFRAIANLTASVIENQARRRSERRTMTG